MSFDDKNLFDDENLNEVVLRLDKAYIYDLYLFFSLYLYDFHDLAECLSAVHINSLNSVLDSLGYLYNLIRIYVEGKA